MVIRFADGQAAQLEHGIPSLGEQQISAQNPKLRFAREPIAGRLGGFEIAGADGVLCAQRKPFGELVSGVDVGDPAALREVDGVADGTQLLRGSVIVEHDELEQGVPEVILDRPPSGADDGFLERGVEQGIGGWGAVGGERYVPLTPRRSCSAPGSP